MKNRIIALVVGMVLLLCSSLMADPNAEPACPFEETESMWFDSLNVRFVGNWPFGGAEEIAIDSLRNLVFLGSRGGVYIFDISEPTNPKKISEKLHTQGLILDLCYDQSSQLLYIVGKVIGLEIWDITDADNPQRLGSCDSLTYANKVFVKDSLAYVTDLFLGLYILDISNAFNPQMVGHCDIFYANGIYVEGSYAFVSSGYFNTIDVSDPANPHIEHEFPLNGITLDLFCVGSYAYIAQDGLDTGFRIVDISTPYAPRPVGFCNAGDMIENVFVLGSYAYLSVAHAFAIANVSDPSNPFIVGYTEDFAAMDAFVSLPYAYIAGGWQYGLEIVNVVIPSNPVLVSNLGTVSDVNGIFVFGNYAYLPDIGRSLRIVDISNPALPYEFGFYETMSRARAVFIEDTLAYIAEGAPWIFEIVNISDPSQPFFVGYGYLFSNGIAGSVNVSGSYAYIGCGFTLLEEKGLLIVDISNPSNPFPTSFFSTSGSGYDVFMKDTIAFLAAGDFYAVNIADPYNPVQVSHFVTQNNATGIAVSDSLAYVADSYDGLRILDISNLSNVQEVGCFDTEYCALDCFLFGSQVFIADDLGGISIIDVSTPSYPQEIGYYEFERAHQLVFADPYIFTTNSITGLQIFEYLGAGVEEEPKEALPAQSSIKILQNPATGNSIKLMLTTSNPDACMMCLYNILGQEVKLFNLENLSMGKNHIDLSIDHIPNGIYFLELKDNCSIQSEKVVILK